MSSACVCQLLYNKVHIIALPSHKLTHALTFRLHSRGCTLLPLSGRPLYKCSCTLYTLQQTHALCPSPWDFLTCVSNKTFFDQTKGPFLRLLTSEANPERGFVSSCYNRMALSYVITIILLIRKLRGFEAILDD